MPVAGHCGDFNHEGNQDATMSSSRAKDLHFAIRSLGFLKKECLCKYKYVG